MHVYEEATRYLCLRDPCWMFTPIGDPLVIHTGGRCTGVFIHTCWGSQRVPVYGDHVEVLTPMEKGPGH